MTKSNQRKIKINLLSRPPVVSVLGHIDHGKTSLLDRIRKTTVAASEAGGITQHIGAYQIDFKGKKITFLDTPGHAAFAKMRARGANATDLAILVVAADEGVKPQTKESLRFIKEAKIPFIVAINKIDLPQSNVEVVMGELAKEDVLVEKKGGQVVMVPVSAKTGQGVEDLLEMIILVAEMAELKANPSGDFQGVVIESGVDRSRGSRATIIVKNGTLSVGDHIWAEKIEAKVRIMLDDKGEPIKKALPSQPVEVFGFSVVPLVGTKVTIQPTEVKKEFPVKEKLTPEEEATQEEEKRLRLILKADTQGTLEAIKLNLPSQIELIYLGLGDINESDVLLSQTTKAWLVGFNVRVPASVNKLAQVEKIKIRSYSIIYELLEEIEKEVLKITQPAATEEVLGEAEILQIFLINRKKVVGGRVLRGRVAKGDYVHLRRGENILGDGRAISLKKGKIEVDKAKVDEEFGVLIAPELDFNQGDVLVFFRKLPEKE